VLKKEYAGHYVIRTNKKYLTAKEIWDFYMNLTGVEASFRSLKSELGTRPVYHQKDDRIEAHLFISVLAYYILRSIIFSLNQKDYHKSWSEIRNVLKMHIRSNIYFTDRNGNDYQVRMTGKPEEEAKKIYDLLKIKLNRYKIVKKMKARK
jgi:transposase